MAQFDRHLSWPSLLDLVTDEVIMSHLADVFGEDSFQLVETRLYPKQPHKGTNWHIDIKQLEDFQPSLLNTNSDDFHSVTTWLALADVPAEMGAIQFVHHKHVNLAKLVRIKRTQPGRYEAVCAAEARRLTHHIETLPMKAGEFVLFDPRDLHTGAVNQTNQLRLGLVIRYCMNHVRVDPRFSKKGDLHIVQIKDRRPVVPARI